MMWIIVLLMCCLPTVESEECSNTDIIMGQFGNEVKVDDKLSDFREEINKYITERDGEKFQKEIKIQSLNNESDIRIKNKINSSIDDVNLGQKEFYMTNDTVMVKINTSEAGVYWIEFNRTSLGQNASTITGVTKGKYTSIIQLECHSVSTSIGDCPLSMYTMWYKNGMRMTEVDPISSQINVTIVNNGGRNVTCLVTEYFPRNDGLQTTTTHYGKPTIIGRSPPNPILKPEDNYTSIIQLECHSVSTSKGDYQLSMYTLWYKNGMRMTDVDPTLSQINVTIDHNGGSFICLATDYLPCYLRLQNTKHYVVVNIEECNNVFESETFIVQPEFAPIDVKLEPDQREITVYKNDDLKVRCTAKCHPKCAVTWGKHFQGLKSSGLIYFTNDKIENDLVIENVNSSHEGYYGCLVNNIHGEVKKSFTLSVKEAEDKTHKDANVITAVTIVVAAIATVIVVAVIVVVIRYKKYQKEKNGVAEDSSPEEDVPVYEEIDDSGLNLDEQLPGTSGDNNSTSSDQYLNSEFITYDVLEFNISNGNRNHGTNPDPENGYTRLSKKRRRKLKHWVLWHRIRE